jgi:hypothetical protein
VQCLNAQHGNDYCDVGNEDDDVEVGELAPEPRLIWLRMAEMIQSTEAARPAIPPQATFADMITLLAGCELVPRREVLLPACDTCARGAPGRK